MDRTRNSEAGQPVNRIFASGPIPLEINAANVGHTWGMDRKPVATIANRWRAAQKRIKAANPAMRNRNEIEALLQLGRDLNTLARDDEGAAGLVRKVCQSIGVAFDTATKARAAASRFDAAEVRGILAVAAKGALTISHLAALSAVDSRPTRLKLSAKAVTKRWSVAQLRAAARARQGRRRQPGAGAKPKRPTTLSEEAQQIRRATDAWLAYYRTWWAPGKSHVDSSRCTKRDREELIDLIGCLTDLADAGQELVSRIKQRLAG